MSLSRAKILLRVAALASTLSITVTEESPSQPPFTTLSDELSKAKSLLNRNKVDLQQSGVNEPETETQLSVPHRQQDVPELGNTRFLQDPSAQQQEFTSWDSPEQSSFFQGAVQEMSNLLASNRKLRYDLSTMQKREGERVKEHAKLGQELESISQLAEAEKKANDKSLVIANEKLKKSNTELQASNAEFAELKKVAEQLQGVNKEFEAANVKLQSASQELISKLDLASQMEKEAEEETHKAEEKTHKAEKEVELMASQLRSAQASMVHTQDMVRKLFPSSKQRRDASQQEVEKVKSTK